MEDNADQQRETNLPLPCWARTGEFPWSQGPWLHGQRWRHRFHVVFAAISPMFPADKNP